MLITWETPVKYGVDMLLKLQSIHTWYAIVSYARSNINDRFHLVDCWSSIGGQ